MTKGQAPPGAQAVLRAVRLLKQLSQTEAEKTLHELSATAKLTKTTTHRLLAALESEGLVVRGTAQSTYRLGPAVIALGMQALRTSDLRGAVRPALDFLAEKTGETATLEILSDNQTLILDEVSGRHLVSASIEIGTRWPLHATSTGKALLAFLPDEERQSLLDSPLTRFTPMTITNRRELLQELERIRSAGYATATEELEVGFNAVASVFRGPMGEVVGAVSIGGPSHRVAPLRLDRLGAQVKAVADGISERMGFDGSAPSKSSSSFR